MGSPLGHSCEGCEFSVIRSDWQSFLRQCVGLTDSISSNNRGKYRQLWSEMQRVGIGRSTALHRWLTWKRSLQLHRPMHSRHRRSEATHEELNATPLRILSPRLLSTRGATPRSDRLHFLVHRSGLSRIRCFHRGRRYASTSDR